MTQQDPHAGAGPGLPERARAFADDLLALAPRSPAFAARVASVSSMGEPDLRAAAALSERFLTADLVTGAGVTRGAGGLDAQALVSAALARLRAVVTRLDPSGAGVGAVRRLLRRVPGTEAGYFARYTAAQDELDAILVDLAAGQDGLRRANAVIEVDRASAGELVARLEQYGELATRLEAILTEEVSRLERSGRTDDADVIRAEAISPLRQRQVDLLTSRSVTLQGRLVLEVVRDTNLELVRGVERARRTTLVALRTAVAVASSGQQQALVLDRISGLGAATEAALAPGSSPEDLDRLRAAFDDVFESLDAVETVREQARGALEEGRRAVTALPGPGAAVSPATGAFAPDAAGRS